MSLEQDILARVKPTPGEESRIKETVSKLEARVMGTDAAKGHDIQLCLVGSIAKDTYLKDPDADIFLLFDPKVPRETLEKVGLAIGREAIDGREHYAEHPYIKGEFMGLRADIVPAYRIIDSSQKMTAVDRTPFHTEYVKANLATELRDDVRLLKALMKGIGIYGADAKTIGFSGYLCELLIIRFGGFCKLLENAARWRTGMRLELGTRTGRAYDDPITFIDPVDPNRNVASAVSADSFALFIAASRAYIESPRQEFYFPNPIKALKVGGIKKALAERGGIISLTIPRPDLIDDILFPQMRKFERNAVQHLESGGFAVMDSYSHALEDSLVIILELQSAELPAAMLHRGPPVSVAENSENFLAKWRTSPDALSPPFIKGGCWQVFARRKHTSAAEHLRHGLDSIDAGKDLNRLRDSARIHEKAAGEPGILQALSAYLDRRMPWDR
ncbi:MAG: CCA tRNA nucleotidyltransferase [Thermoplasmata archaeon]